MYLSASLVSQPGRIPDPLEDALEESMANGVVQYPCLENPLERMRTGFKAQYKGRETV